MSEKRFKRVYEKRKGQLYITDDFYDSGDDYFPHNLDYDECIRLLNEYDKKYNEYRNDVLRLEKENEELKQELINLHQYTDDEFKETKRINKIYEEEGFYGVIDYAKDKLKEFGMVKEVEKGLWVLVTGGWSENEWWIDSLNNILSIFGMKHYCGCIVGGAFYYTEQAYDDIEIRLKKKREGDDMK